MKTRNCSWFTVAGALILAVTMVPGALAQCGLNKNYKPAAWHPQIGSTHLMRTALFDDDDDSDSPLIVGMWHVTFTAHTVNGQPIPSDSYPMIDNAIVVWHNDKTEIMNVNLSEDGNKYSGTFTLVAYNLDKTKAIAFTGVLAGTRITTSTSATSLF
jgi:hypothetical protein